MVKVNQSQTVVVTDEAVMHKIFVVRSHKVMLDRDLAKLYGIKPIRLREQVKRNAERFPNNFMFQLTADEVEAMVSQNAIPSKQQLGGALPYAFTEHGVLMLANVLRSKTAIQASIRIIEIFVRLREMTLTQKDILLQLEKLERKVSAHDADIQAIFGCMKQLLHPQEGQRRRIGYRRSGEED